MTSTTIGSDGQYELRQQQGALKRTLIRTADELVRALEVEPYNVALAMFRINRFGGQVHDCEVMGHSLRVHNHLLFAATNAARIWALLHDCHEIITGDLVRPYKSVRLSRAQAEIDAAIQARFCPSITGDDIEMVRVADVAVGDDELRAWERHEPLLKRTLGTWVTLFRDLQKTS